MSLRETDITVVFQGPVVPGPDGTAEQMHVINRLLAALARGGKC